MLNRVESLIAKLGSQSGWVLLSLLIIVVGAWTFMELADDVTEGDTQQLDERIVRSLRTPDTDPIVTNREVPIGPKWLQETGRDITGLGGVAILSLLISAVAGYLLMVRKFHAMWLVLAATLGALLISSLLKNFFDRPRPDVTHFSHVYTSSFPSGHAMMSASVYLTLGILLTRLVEGRLIKTYFLTVAVLVTFLVGVSRVYMGVHYPSDVLAGWTAGLVWALICWLVARYLQRRGSVESPPDVEPAADTGATRPTLPAPTDR